MDNDEILAKVIKIVSKYLPKEEIVNDVSLTAIPHYLSARSLASVLLNIEQVFGVDLNKIITRNSEFSVDSLCCAIAAEINS
jgi:hypothetical protein